MQHILIVYTLIVYLLSYPEAHSLGRGHGARVVMQQVVHFVRRHLGVGASSIHVHIYIYAVCSICGNTITIYTHALYTSLFHTNIYSPYSYSYTCKLLYYTYKYYILYYTTYLILTLYT